MTKARELSDYTGLQGDLALKSTVASPVFTGNVGVGVTPEAWSTTGVVQVGRVSLTGTPSAIGGSLNWNAYYNSGWKYKDSLQAGSMTLDNGIFTFKVAPSGTADAAISWTTAMTIDNAGAVTMPAQPAFLAYQSTQQANIAINGQVKILFDSEVFDQNADFNTSTNTFTAPVTGKYFLTINLVFNAPDAAAGFYQFQIATSNRTFIQTNTIAGSTDPTYWTWNYSVIADMDAGDTAFINFYQNVGTAQLDVRHGNETTFSGYLAC